MVRRYPLFSSSSIIVFFFFIIPSFVLSAQAATPKDPYKVLGVDRSASQREIQKAFHKLSLQYHPDKNKSKGAQDKFAEINNAYDILSDEEKRKNYDLYGNDNGGPGSGGSNFSGGNFGGNEGYTFFTSGGPGDSRSTFRPDGSQTRGGQGNAESFFYSFGGDPGESRSSFGSGFSDIFADLFGFHSKDGSHPGSFKSSAKAKTRFSTGSIQAINLHTFKKEINGQGLTWLLLFYMPITRGYHEFESIAEDVANSLQGAIKAGKINCQNEQALCKDLGVWPSKSARLFSYKPSEGGSLAKYTGTLDARKLKSFCLEQLPRFSRRVSPSWFDSSSSSVENLPLPQVLLLSTKKDTPVIWRVLSGLFHKRFNFFDAEVHDVSDITLKRLRVDALPAVVGRLANGEEYVLRTGITIKDLKRGISEMKSLLESFEMKNKKATSGQAKKPSQTSSQGNGVPYLTSSNMDALCGDSTALCIIGVFRSSKAKDTLEPILSLISQKTLTRRIDQPSNSGDSVSYSLVDATKQTAFLNSMDKSGFKTVDKLLVAFKPKKGKFAVLKNEMTSEEVERFIGSVLNGDIKFSKIRQKPVLK